MGVFSPLLALAAVDFTLLPPFSSLSLFPSPCFFILISSKSEIPLHFQGVYEEDCYILLDLEVHLGVEDCTD